MTMKTGTISKILLSLMVLGQFGWAGAAMAEETPSPTPVATVEPTMTPTPTVEPTPEPTVVPTPTAEADVTPLPTVVPKASTEPTGTPTPTPVATEIAKADSGATGAPGCGGVIPRYAFDNNHDEWVATDKESFSCDIKTGYWLSPKYSYNPRSGWYEILTPAQSSDPEYITAPNIIRTVLGDMVVGSKDYEVAKSLGLLVEGSGGILLPAGSAAAGTTGTATASAAIPQNGQSWFDLTNLVNVINVLQSNAVSGSVNADSNTEVGNVGTGAASVVANLINLLASAWSWSNGNLSFFMQNVLAPLTGDINLNPTVTTTEGGGALGQASIGQTGAESTNMIDINNPSRLEVTAKDTGSITNNVDVNAVSGDVTANKNTQVGDVSTGDAMAQVNIINLINSFITSGSSFFGILNIFGSLNGDILFPLGFLNGLVPAGSAPGSTTASIGETGAGSSNELDVNNAATANINNTTFNSVNNNITTTAASGAASAGSNTEMGEIGTGNATTNQSLFNMANTSIFGDNAVLVMVNVLGRWVGKIMTLPGTGVSQSALLTGNAAATETGPITNMEIDGTGADSTNKAAADNSTAVNADLQSTGTITNNVRVNAQSGDAKVTANTSVGDVATGNAQATSSTANLFNSMLNVKNWFGVLIINVFGDWVGDLNNDTAAGGYSRDAAGQGAGVNQETVKTEVMEQASARPMAAQIGSVGLLSLMAPKAAVNKTESVQAEEQVVAATVQAGDDQGNVLTAAAQTGESGGETAAAKTKNMSWLFMISALALMVAGALLSIEKKLRR